MTVRRVKQLSITEELDYVSSQVAVEIDRAIEEFHQLKKNRISKNLVKKVNRGEILEFLFDKFSREIVIKHLDNLEKIKEKEKEEYLANFTKKKDQSNHAEHQKTMQGYSNKLYTKGKDQFLPSPTLTPTSKISPEVLFEQQFNKRYTEENPFHDIIGNPEIIAEELIGEYDTEWPEIPWHRGDIRFRVRNKINPFGLLGRGSTNLLMGLNLLGGFISVFILFSILSSYISAFGSNGFNKLAFFRDYIVGYPETTLYYIPIGLFFILSGLLYSSSFFSIYVDNPIRNVAITDILRRLHLFTYSLFIVILGIGSSFYTVEISRYYDNAYDRIDYFTEIRPLNNYPLDAIQLIIYIPTIIFYYSMNFYKNRTRKPSAYFDRTGLLSLTVFHAVLLFYYFAFSNFSLYILDTIARFDYFDNYSPNKSEHYITLFWFNIILVIIFLITIKLLHNNLQVKERFDWKEIIFKYYMIGVLLSVVLNILLFVRGIKSREIQFIDKYSLSYSQMIFTLFIYLGYTYCVYRYFKPTYESLVSNGFRTSIKNGISKGGEYIRNRMDQ